MAAKILLNRIKKGIDNYKPENIELKTTFVMTESVADIAWRIINNFLINIARRGKDVSIWVLYTDKNSIWGRYY